MPTATAARTNRAPSASSRPCPTGRRSARTPAAYSTIPEFAFERSPAYSTEGALAGVAGARPFLKWAGGKSQLLTALQYLLPSEFRNYFEPFAGGAALFFYLRRTGRIRSGCLGDMNEELVTAYSCVRDDVEAVLGHLRRHATKHIQDPEAHFYRVRKERPRDPFLRAARLIYLNRTCFNGLWRVNGRGEFNVPMGHYKNPLIHNVASLRAAAQALQHSEAVHADFEAVARRAKKNDLVYFDPPYVPLSQTASFTAYTKDAFGREEQERLAKLFIVLTARGCKVMLSNSGTDVVKALYEPVARRIICLPARRAISSRAATRGPVMEYVVLNYEPDSQLLPLD